MKPTAATMVAAVAMIALVAGCASDDDESSAAPSSTPPPPTSGVQPWGSDLHGFEQARCDGDDVAVRMVWRGDFRFTVCRDVAGTRYLQAWTTWDPKDLPRGQRTPFRAVRGDFFTDTPNSVQFVAEGAKIDIGPTVVTILWPSEPGSRTTRSTSVETGPGWTRLN